MHGIQHQRIECAAIIGITSLLDLPVVIVAEIHIV